MAIENLIKKPTEEEILEARWKIHAAAFGSGIPAFQDVEPPGGYDTSGQPGDLIEGVVIEIEQELKQTA